MSNILVSRFVTLYIPYDIWWMVYCAADMLTAECLARTCRALYARRNRTSKTVLHIAPAVLAVFSGKRYRDNLYIHAYQIRCGPIELHYVKDKYIKYTICRDNSKPAIHILQPIASCVSEVTPEAALLSRRDRRFVNIVSQRFIRDFVTYLFNYSDRHAKIDACIVSHRDEAACRRCTYLKLTAYLAELY
jgi:hypothetical protein